MPTALRCPRCRTSVQAHWTRCPACGFEPPSTGGARPGSGAAGPPAADDPAGPGAAGGPTTAGSEPAGDEPRERQRDPDQLLAALEAEAAGRPVGSGRRVYDPDADDDGPSPVVVVALVTVAVLLVGLILVGVFLEVDDGDPGPAAGPVALGRTAEERDATDLGDGWWLLSLDDGAVTVELPGPLLRTRDELAVVGELQGMPAAVWTTGNGTEEVFALVVAEPPGSWGRSPEDLLGDVSITVADQVVAGDGVPTRVADLPAVRRFAGGGGRTTATTTVATGDELLILVARTDPSRLDEVLERMESSLRVG